MPAIVPALLTRDAAPSTVPETAVPSGREATEATLRLLVRLSLVDTGWTTIEDASSRVSCESSEHSSSCSSV